MKEIWDNNYLAAGPIAAATKRFAAKFTESQRVLDVGCGTMPYKKYFSAEYVGMDPLPDVEPNIVGVAWDIPLPSNEFDAVILNQSLEHIAETEKTVAEIFRVLKPGGFVLVTVPQTMKNHSRALPASDAPVANFDMTKEPYWRVDYYRFTKFGLMYLFRNFEIESLRATNGYGSTIAQLVNYFFVSLQRDWLFRPIYIVNNVLGLTLDGIFSLFGKGKLYHFAYSTLTINYIMVARKPIASS